MTDRPLTPTPLPLNRRCRCGTPILVTQATGWTREVRLDPEPGAAGLYRLAADGTARAVSPADAAPGEALYAPHRCGRGPAGGGG